jgi:diacylglycerol kinase family enzyme
MLADSFYAGTPAFHRPHSKCCGSWDVALLVRLRQLAALACGLIRFDPDVRVEAADWVRVEGGANTPVQVDGEMLCALPVEISLHPQRLQLILPMV